MDGDELYEKLLKCEEHDYLFIVALVDSMDSEEVKVVNRLLLLGICFWREGLEAALGPELREGVDRFRGNRMSHTHDTAIILETIWALSLNAHEITKRLAKRADESDFY